MNLIVIWLVLSYALVVDGQIKSTMIDIGTYFTRSLRLADQSVFHSLTTPSFSHCVKVCVLFKSCHAVTFDIQDGVCKLADNGTAFQATTDQRYLTTAPSTLATTPPYVTSFASECDGNACSTGSRCIRLASGLPHCVITECPHPAQVSNGISDPVTNRSVGAVVNYTCNPGYIYGGAANRTCKADGSWTEGICQPEPFEGAFTYQGLYTDFQQASSTCGGSLPLLNPPTVSSVLSSSMASSIGYCANCPNVLIAGPTPATLFSDRWPDTYQDLAGCTCRIDANKVDYKIQLEILSLNLESCCDNLYIYDGPDRTFPIMGKYTGDLTASVTVIVSSANQMYLEFKSDASVQRPGYEIRYTEVSSTTVSTPPSTLSPPSALPMYYWVLGQIDESLMVWTYPDGTNVTQSVSMYPSWSYLQNNYASTGVYYNGVPFSDYRLCFSITYQSLIGINPALRSCHVACHDPNVV